MAHELDTRANGLASFVGRRPAWHRLGSVLAGENDALSLDDALELGGLNYEVRTVPLYVREVVAQPGTPSAASPRSLWTPDDWATLSDETETTEQFYELDDQATMRMDRHVVLGTVGPRYTPLQNRDAFRVLEPLLDKGVARIETAGALREGRDVWMLIRFDIDSDIVRRVFAARQLANGKRTGGTIPYGLITNNHAGNRQVVLMETPIEVVCANTLGAALRGLKGELAKGRAFKIKHTVNVEQRTVEAARAMFDDVVAQYEGIAEQYELLRQHFLDVSRFRRLVCDIVAPIPAKLDRPKLTAREETSRQQIETQRARLEALFLGAADGVDGSQSAWDAYMAVTQSIDHDELLWKARGGEQGRLAALYDGRLAAAKQEAVDSLVAYCVDETAGV